MKNIYYSYEAFRQDLKDLTQKIDEPFDTIIGIARGGLSMAQLLSEYYNIRRVYTLNTIGYDGQEKREGVEVFALPPLDASTKRVLIVDDIVDSGETLEEVLSLLENAYPHIIFYSATIFYKKSAKIAPTWFIREPKGWVDFFWSEDIKGN
jgi:xanthine phosphoribosyltransferase